MVRWLKWLLLVLPAALWFLLDSLLGGSGNMSMLFLYSLLPLLGILQFHRPKMSRWTWAVSMLLLVLFAALLVMEILMIPYQAYLVWFDLLEQHSTRGRISRLFSKLGVLIGSLLLSILLNKKRFDWSMLFLPAFLGFLLYPGILTAVLCLTLYLLPQLLKQKDKALLFLIFLSFLAGWTGLKAEPQGLKWIDYLSSHLYDRFIETFPDLPLVYQVPLYGQSLTDYVEDGGKPALTSQTLLKVEGEPGHWVYLRTNLFERFDSMGNLSPVTKSISREELAESPGERSGNELQITLLTDFMNILPLTLNTREIQTGQGNFLWDNRSLRLNWASPPLLYEEKYRLVEDRSIQLVEDEEKLDWLKKKPTASAEIRNLAEQLKGQNDEETVQNIQAYLLDGFSYTLETEGREDFLDYFLFESRKGYCLHFATAFIYLSRLNGIPCRMAEGYIAYLPQLEVRDQGGTPGEAILTGYSAHSWPEVYLSETGWKTFEVTPPYYHEETSYSGGSDFLQTSHSRGEIIPAGKKQKPEGAGKWLIPLPLIPAVFLLWILKGRNRPGKLLVRLRKKGLRMGWTDPNKTGWVKWGRSRRETEEILPLILQYRYGSAPLTEEQREQLRQGYHRIRQLRR